MAPEVDSLIVNHEDTLDDLGGRVEVDPVSMDHVLVVTPHFGVAGSVLVVTNERLLAV